MSEPANVPNKQNKINPTTSVTNKDILKIMDKRFNNVNQRFDRIDKHFDKIDQHFDTINHKFDQQNSKFDNINLRFDHMLYIQFATILSIIIATISLLAKLGAF